MKIAIRQGMLWLGIFLLMWGTTGYARADTFTLDVKKLDTQSQFVGVSDGTQRYRFVIPQQQSYQKGIRQQSRFPAVIQKEPEKYECSVPFKGVIKLGSSEYGFALDSSDISKKGYDFLYFDVNHNGDLTDEKRIEALPLPSGINFGEGSAQREFPNQEITIQDEGKEVEYSTGIYAYSSVNSKTNELRYAFAAFRSMSYRTGAIELNGKKHQVALLDFNSNGSFNDAYKVARTNSGRNNDTQQFYPQYGDILLIDPPTTLDNMMGGYGLSDSPDRCPVGKLIWIDDRFYAMDVSADGKQLTLTPSDQSFGYVTNANSKWSAAIFSGETVLKINGDKNSKVPVPEGDWQLLECRIDQSPEGQGNQTQGITMVTAQGTGDSPVVKVAKDADAAAFPFGPPYKPKVAAQRVGGSTTNANQFQLSMTLIGSGGESCSGLYVNGKRPENPSFVIATPGGEIVERGNFEYG